MAESTMGHFDETGEGFVITHNGTPRMWRNYHWTAEGYYLGTTQLGNSFSNYVDEQNNRNTITGGEDKYVFLRDEDTMEPWCPAGYPIPEPVEEFQCVQHVAYTSVSSVRDGIRASWRSFVPRHGYHESWTITVGNESDRPRRIGVYPFTRWSLTGFAVELDWQWQGAFSYFIFDDELGCALAENKCPKRPHDRYMGVMASSAPVESWDCHVEHFMGPLGQICHPDALYDQAELARTTAGHIGGGAVLQHILELDPGECATIQVVLGVVESRDEAADLIRTRLDPARVEADLAEVGDYWRDLNGRITVDLPDEKLQTLVNCWLKKQMQYTLVGKQGLRDNLQISDALVTVDQERAGHEILKVFGFQYQDGHTIKSWIPWVTKYYSDGPIWLVLAGVGLLKETGDKDLLDKVIPYVDEGEGTLYEHLQRAVTRLWDDRGPHNLCLARYADWNDDLNMEWNPNAESVWVTMGLGYMVWEMIAVAEWAGDSDYADKLRGMHAELRDTVEVAWDGEWYMRAMSDDFLYGSHTCEEGKIFVNSQSWAVFGHIAEGERAEQVAAAVDEYLMTEYGPRTCWPPYSKWDERLGAISALKPGHGTNGSVYCHAATFKLVMDCILGRAEQCWDTLQRIMPDGLNPSSHTQCEPYSFTNCYQLTVHDWGETYQAWMTGTCGWAFKVVTEWMLGLRRDYEGLLVDPCLPTAWTDVGIERVFRGARYKVRIENPDGRAKGVREILVDGEPIEGVHLPALAPGQECDVLVRM